MRVLGWIATKIRHTICKLPYLFSVYGHCKQCGDCCKWGDTQCPHLKNNMCTVHNDRPLTCRVAPYCFDLWWDDKFKRCKFKNDKDDGSKFWLYGGEE